VSINYDKAKHYFHNKASYRLAPTSVVVGLLEDEHFLP